MNARRYDAMVVGGGACGLVAAAYLARGGAATLLLEARNKLGGRLETIAFGDGFSAPAVTHALSALDPRVMKELKLARQGLRFSARDMALSVLRRDGKPLTLSRDRHATRRAIAAVSEADAARWPLFRKRLFAAARAMRGFWWEDGALPDERAIQESIQDLRRKSAAAWLDAAFESDALKAPFAFDAMAGGLSPLDAGSALVPLWQAAQEMCGLQGAVAFPAGGPASLASVLERAARAAGADIRTGAAVESVLLDGDAVSGVRLASDEVIAANLVLAALPRRRVLRDLVPAGAAGFALSNALDRAAPVTAAKILLALDRDPGLPAGRIVVAERIESLAAAHAAARAGKIPDELALEIVSPSSIESGFAPAGQCALSIAVRPLPRLDAAGWNAARGDLLKRVLAALGACVPNAARHVVASEVLTPFDIEARYGARDMQADIAHMLSPWRARVATPIRGLYACGGDAEAVPCTSGRAGRIAAAIALAERAP